MSDLRFLCQLIEHRRPVNEDRQSGVLEVLGVLAPLALLSACATPVINEPPQARPSSLALEDPGTIIVFDDEECFIREQTGDFTPASFDLPDYADRATVFLNGWRLVYAEDDHHIARIEVELRNISVTNGVLDWEVRGLLADRNFDDDYSFCYTYTVIGWNSGLIDAATVDGDPPANAARGEALTVMPTFQAIPPALRGRKTVAILPKGFFLQVPDDDRHLLQAGTNLGHNDFLLEKGKTYGELGMPPIVANASRFDRDITSWDYTALLSDNDLEDETSHVSRFGLLTGDDLTMVRPPFTLVPREDANLFNSGCPGVPLPPAPPLPAGLQSNDIVIENLPFDYAVPVLSGWFVRQLCDDEHVKDIGVWLDNIAYDKDQDEPTGTLRYTVHSILLDNDDDRVHLAGHKVDILGIDGREPTDLVVERNGGGACFDVRVVNTGDDDAKASVTRFQIDGATIDIDTPAIAKGFSFLIKDIELPPGVCGGDCSFEVTADATMTVQESAENNNVLEGICVG